MTHHHCNEKGVGKMIARTQCCVLLSVLGVLLFMPAYGTGTSARIPEPECEERKRTSMEKRLRGATMDFMDVLPENWHAEEVTIHFVRIEFHRADVDDALTYGCQPVTGVESFPAHIGFAWIVVMPNETTFSLVDRSAADTTIRSYLNKEVGGVPLNSLDSLSMLVSGPFWRLSRRGELPIGVLVRDTKKVQDFRPDFSAKHVLCSKEDGSIELIVGKAKMFDESATTLCAAAIQVGPALFERSTNVFGPAKLGIGGNSTNRSRRNVLIKVKANDPAHEAEGDLILLSTLFDIASYDAMIASELLVRKLPGRGEIVWAVGLVDDESLSGPVFTMNGRPVLQLTEVSRPTGAIMQFIFDGGKR